MYVWKAKFRYIIFVGKKDLMHPKSMRVPFGRHWITTDANPIEMRTVACNTAGVSRVRTCCDWTDGWCSGRLLTPAMLTVCDGPDGRQDFPNLSTTNVQLDLFNANFEKKKKKIESQRQWSVLRSRQEQQIDIRERQVRRIDTYRLYSSVHVRL